MNCLRRSGIATVGELISKKPRELLKLRNFGQKSFHEIEEKLQEIGLSLAASAELKAELESAISEEEDAEPESGITTEEEELTADSESQSEE